jgi:hypothetical protein
MSKAGFVFAGVLVCLGEPLMAQVATLGQAFMGPLGDGRSACTVVLVTNRDPENACAIDVFFDQGAQFAQTIPRINGDETDFANATAPSGGVVEFALTSPGALLQGKVTVFTGPPCNQDSLSVQASYFLGEFDQVPGSVSEAFTLRPNTSETWLRDGRCLAISTNQGPGPKVTQNLGIAYSGVIPGLPAPSGTSLAISLFDGMGNPVGATTLEVDGQHQAFFPSGSLPSHVGLGTFIFCLISSDANFELDVTGVRVNQRGPTFEFDAAIFADGFESGDLSAWSGSVP